MNLSVPILAFAITAGQLIRLPIGTQGITILDITVSLFCLWGLLKIKFHLKKPPAQITAALFFIFVSILSLTLTPLNLNPNEYFLSSSYIVRFSLYVILTWLVFSGALGDLHKQITQVFFLSGISFAVLGLLQFLFYPNLDFLTIAGWDPHYFRTVSTFLDPNFTGAFLVLTLLLLPSLRGVTTTKQSSLIFILVYAALLTTFSRSGYLMFLVSGLVFSYLKKSKTLALATLIFFLILMAGFQTYAYLVSQPRNIDRAQSATARLNTWQQGFKLFTSHPILGVGFNSYRYALKKYQLGDTQFLQSHGSSGNDSSLLFVLSTTGILGFLVYLYFLWTLISSSNWKNITLVAAVSGLIIHSLFANSLFYPPILAWILLISIAPKK